MIRISWGCGWRVSSSSICFECMIWSLHPECSSRRGCPQHGIARRCVIDCSSMTLPYSYHFMVRLWSFCSFPMPFSIACTSVLFDLSIPRADARTGRNSSWVGRFVDRRWRILSWRYRWMLSLEWCRCCLRFPNHKVHPPHGKTYRNLSFDCWNLYTI